MNIQNYPESLPAHVKTQLDALYLLLDKYSTDTTGYALPCVDIMLEYILRQDYVVETLPEHKTYYQETIATLRAQKRNIIKECAASHTKAHTRAELIEATSSGIKWIDYGFEEKPITQDLYEFQQTLLFAENKIFDYLTDLLDIEHQVMRYRIALNNDIHAYGALSEADILLIKELMANVKSSILEGTITIPEKSNNSFSASASTRALSPHPEEVCELKKMQSEFRSLPSDSPRKKNLLFKGLDMSPSGPLSIKYLWDESESSGELEYKDNNCISRMKLTAEGKRPFEHRKQLLKEYADRINQLAGEALVSDLAMNFQRNGQFNHTLRGGLDENAYSNLQNKCLLTLLQVHLMGLTLVNPKDILNEEKYKELQHQLWSLSFLLENVESGANDGFENLSFHAIPSFQIGNTDALKKKFKEAYIATESLGLIQEAILKEMTGLIDAGIQEIKPGKLVVFDNFFDLAKKILHLRCSLVQDVWNNSSLPLTLVKDFADAQANKILQILPTLSGGSNKVQQSTVDTHISSKSKASAAEAICTAMAIGLVLGVFASVAFIALSQIPALAPFTDMIVKDVVHIATALILTVVSGVALGAASGGIYYAYNRFKNPIEHEDSCTAMLNAASHLNTPRT